MAATPLTDVATRLKANVIAEVGDQAPSTMTVPSVQYRDPELWAQEIEHVYRRSPLCVALSVDIPNPGDYFAYEIAGLPVLVVRGTDGVARTFLNGCRHRGAQVACSGFGSERRFTCPYHAWVYDAEGSLVGMAGRETFGEVDVKGLLEYPTQERIGMVFAVLTEGAEFDLDAWLGDMAESLAFLGLENVHRYERSSELTSGNWKATADGYLDGYHLGYLHRNSIGAKSITNRNTYDIYGPHVRIGFANKPLMETGDAPVEEWDLPQCMSLVHYVFPNISISGQPGRALMLSRIVPGPTVGQSAVLQYHYLQQPIEDDATREAMEARRIEYARVTQVEDFDTVVEVTRSASAMGDHPFNFGRNEPANQTLHRWVADLVKG